MGFNKGMKNQKVEYDKILRSRSKNRVHLTRSRSRGVFLVCRGGEGCGGEHRGVLRGSVVQARPGGKRGAM